MDNLPEEPKKNDWHEVLNEARATLIGDMFGVDLKDANVAEHLMDAVADELSVLDMSICDDMPFDVLERQLHRTATRVRHAQLVLMARRTAS